MHGTLPSGFRELGGRGDGKIRRARGMGDTKETVSSRHNRADTHRNSESMVVCTEPAQLQAKKETQCRDGYMDMGSYH